MEYFALILPISAIVVALLFFKNRFTWWEMVLPIVVCIFLTIICKLIAKTTIVSDKEYWGSMVVRARYYEYWETWEHKTCSYTVSCGKNCTTTIYYDCSYCDENSAYWVAYDDAGNSWSISKEYYAFLKDKWSSPLSFVELDRSIDFHGGCGQDGDAYDIFWRSDPMHSEAAVTTHSYTNRVQAAHSAFNLPHITRKEARIKGLYDYPPSYSYYKQKVVLGLDSIYSYDEVTKAEQLMQYLNGHYGTINKVKVFVCLFYNRPISVSFDQEAYWDGGNQNELVVCIGMQKNGTIDWVRPFSWTDRKRIIVDCREDIANMKKFNIDGIYSAITRALSNNDVHKNFKKDFSYLTVELPNWSLILIWVLTLLSTVGLFVWGVGNEFETETTSTFDIFDWMTGGWKRVKRYFDKQREQIRRR